MSGRPQAPRIAEYYIDVALDGWAVVRPVLELVAGVVILAVGFPLFLIGLSARGTLWAADRIPQWVFNFFLEFLAWHAHVVLVDENLPDVSTGRQTSLTDFE